MLKKFVFLAALLVQPAMTLAEGIVWKNGKLSRLVPTVGTYNTDAVLNDADVERALDSLDAHTRSQIRTDLGTIAPIAFDGSTIIVTGGKPHSVSADAVAVGVKPYDGSVTVALLENQVVTVYTSETFGLMAVPPGIRHWVRDQKDGQRNVQVLIVTVPGLKQQR